MNDRLRFIEFNVGIIFISSSAVLGRYITASSTLATLWRCMIAAICLYLISKAFRLSLSFNWKIHGGVLIGTSLLMAIHWTTYFYSLDFSNVSVALMTLYTFPAITAILEPLWHKKRIPFKNILLAIAALVAVYIIAPPFSVGADMRWAVGLGLLSALCYSIRNIWIISISSSYTGTTIMTYQLAWMTIFLLPSLFWIPISVNEVEWGAIIILGVGTTAIGHTLFMRGLAFYKATTASIMASIVPVYAIILGYLVLSEIPTLRTLIGGSLIIGIVVIKALDRNPDY